MAEKPLAHLRHFASDTYAPICSTAWVAMNSVNENHSVAYGDDQHTAKAVEEVRKFLSAPTAEVFFITSGTAANALTLAAMVQPFQSIAPEFYTGGSKLLPTSGANGKITPEAFDKVANTRKGDVHFPQVGAVVVTQATEMGTVYTVEEVKAIAKVAKSHRIRVLMDGARFCNALASLGCSPAELTWQAGVDALVFGNSKLGGSLAEAVVFFSTELAYGFRARCKQAGQLMSKARFYTAPWAAMISSGAWQHNASHANTMAQLLHDKLHGLKGVKIMFPRQANSVFVEMPIPLIEAVHALGWKFYVFIGDNGCRMMCSWDTIEADVLAFVDDIARLAEKHSS